jgi:hypothetical protein
MSRRKWGFLVALVIVLTIGAELAVRPWYSSTGSVRIVNEGPEPIEDLVVSYSSTKVYLGRLEAGSSTKARFTAAGKGSLTLDFKQKGNPLNGFQVADFDPTENRQNGFMLVLIVRTNQVVRFMDDDDPSSSPLNLMNRITEWMRADLEKGR